MTDTEPNRVEQETPEGGRLVHASLARPSRVRAMFDKLWTSFESVTPGQRDTSVLSVLLAILLLAFGTPNDRRSGETFAPVGATADAGPATTRRPAVDPALPAADLPPDLLPEAPVFETPPPFVEPPEEPAPAPPPDEPPPDEPPPDEPPPDEPPPEEPPDESPLPVPLPLP